MSETFFTKINLSIFNELLCILTLILCICRNTFMFAPNYPCAHRLHPQPFNCSLTMCNPHSVLCLPNYRNSFWLYFIIIAILVVTERVIAHSFCFRVLKIVDPLLPVQADVITAQSVFCRKCIHNSVVTIVQPQAWIVQVIYFNFFYGG